MCCRFHYHCMDEKSIKTIQIYLSNLQSNVGTPHCSNHTEAVLMFRTTFITSNHLSWSVHSKSRLDRLAGSSPEGWAVVGQDNELGFALTDHLLGLFVAQDVFSTLHHQLETRVDGLHGLFLEKTTTK